MKEGGGKEGEGKEGQTNVSYNLKGLSHLIYIVYPDG